MYRIYLLLIILLQAAAIAYGQQLPVYDGNELNETDSTGIAKYQLDEAVVVSFRDGIEVKRLPASTTVVGLKQIERYRIETLRDLTTLTPNLFMPDYGSQLTSPIFIRGVGSRLNSPSVGLYVDYIPYFDKATFDFDLYDIQHIEVLRGPQGTLYGRNTMGGIINVFSLSPLTYQGTRASVSGGNYRFFNGNLSHYGKLSEKTAFSVAGNYQQRGGYFTNIYDGSESGRLNNGGGRVRLAHQFSKAVVAEVFAQYDRSEQKGYPYVLIDRNDPSKSAINQNDTSFYKRDLVSTGAVVEWTTTDFVLRAVTGYSFLKDKQQVDQDFSPLALATATQDRTNHIVSEEIIMKSNTNDNYQWLLGVFGFWQQNNTDVVISFGHDAVKLGMVPALMVNAMTYDQPTVGWAFFHQSKWNNLFTEGLSVAAGLRIDGENSKSEYRQVITFPQSGRKSVNEPYIPNLEYIQALPKFIVNYQFNPQHSVYTSVAKGYKTGGFNMAVERLADATFDPEYSWNYEAGFKLDFFKGNLSAQGAVFYIDWRNQQIYQFNPSGVGSILLNAGKSESKGIELSARAVPFRSFTVNASYGYTQAKFTDYKKKNAKTGEVTDFTGNYIPYVPHNTLSASALYTINLSTKFINQVDLNLQYLGTGKIYWDESNANSQPFYNVFNARVAVKHYHMVEFAVWAQNIFDHQYQTFFFEELGNSYLQYGKPFLVGADLRINF